MSMQASVAAGSVAPPPTGDQDPDQVEVALLDLDGVVVWVNQAWTDFCLANDGDPSRAGIGTSYLAACEAVPADPSASAVADAIRRALRGRLAAPVHVRIPCDSPQAARRFEVQVASRFSDAGVCVGGIVTLSRVAEPEHPGEVGHPGEAGRAGDPDLAGARLGQGEAVPLLEAAPDALLAVGASGRILYVNRQLESLSGYSRDELIGRPVEMLVPEPDRGRHRRLREVYAAAPQPRVMGRGTPLQLRRRDGTPVSVEVSLGPATVDGQPVVLAAVRDIRERRELEERLRLVADLLDSTGDAVIVLDVATDRWVYVNQAVLDRTGCSRKDLPAIPIGAPTDRAEAARVRAAIAAVVTGRPREVALDSYVAGPGGDRLPVEVRITHRPAAPGSAGPGHVILVARDISDRLAAQERLRVGEESFRTAFEHAPIGMAVTVVEPDGSRRIVRANAALGTLLGVTAHLLVGRDFTEFTHPEDDQADRRAAALMAAGALPRYERRKRYRRPDGSTVWATLHEGVVDFPDLAGTTTLSHVVDVTAGHAEERRRALGSAISQAVAEVTTAVLSGRPLAEVHQQVVEAVARVFDAESVTLDLPGARGRDVQVRAGRTGGPDAGPRTSALFALNGGEVGRLSMARPAGTPPFGPDEVELHTGMAGQLALAVALGQARLDQERLALLEERQRIARDLHDHVIQDMYAVGMQLSRRVVRQARSPDPDPDPGLDSSLIDQVDRAIRRLRGAVLELGAAPSRDSGSVSSTLRALAAQAAMALEHQPTLVLTGAVDDLPGPVAVELTAVLREALSNVARHARATATALAVDVAAGQVTLTVEDDGVGIPADVRPGTGLANIRARAELLHGRVTVSARRSGGSRLQWVARTTDDLR